MKLLIKNSVIIDQNSAFHQQKKDVLIEDGQIVKIADKITNKDKIEEVSSDNLHVSVGWMDIGTQLGEPGLEHRETFDSAVNAARAGGFTSLAPFPNTIPVLQNKAAITVLKEVAKKMSVHIYPVAALTKDCAGTEITEMYDLFLSGAVAFSDGLKSVQHNGVFLNALNYVKAFDGIIIHFPQDAYLSKDGQMHEGFTSTISGMKGVPEMAETIMVQRDLALNQYAASKLVFYGVSSEESLKLIKSSGQKNVKCVLPYLNLLYDDSNLAEFDSNLKVAPPLRSAANKNKLIKAIQSDTIHAIASNHYPLDEESKKLEFTYAKFGASGIETVFSALNTALRNKVKTEDLIEKMTAGPRSVLNITSPKIEVGTQAELTIFDPDLTWTFNKSLSLSKNNPFLGKTLTGKVIGTVVKGKFFRN